MSEQQWTQEWAELTDPSGQRWWIDVPFLLSNWTCIYGNGCMGAFNAESHVGCCDIGVYFPDETDPDIANVQRRVDEMDDSEFTNAKQIRKQWLVNAPLKGELKTRVFNGACVFLNSPDHPNGAGCSLHQGALKRGEDPRLWKPVVCSWTVLFVLEDVDDPFDNDSPKTINFLTKYEDEYGLMDDGSEYADWWCVNDEAAYIGDKPVYLSMEWELRHYLGSAFYEQVAEYLDRRAQGWVPVTIGRPSGDGIAERLRTDPDSAATLAAYLHAKRQRVRSDS